MSTVVPTASALYAALLGLLAAVLTVRVILNRVKTGIQAGDGGNAQLGQAIRAHANLSEQAPLALLLIVLVEVLGTPVGFVHALGGVLVLGRLSNAWGLSHSLGPTQPRQAGAGLTVLVVVAASLLIVYRVLAAQLMGVGLRPHTVHITGEGNRVRGSSRRARSSSNSACVSKPIRSNSSRSCSKLARNSRAPADPPCHMASRPCARMSTRPMGAHARGQVPPVARVRAARRHDALHRGLRLQRALVWMQRRVGRHRQRIELLADQPAARLQRADHLREGQLALREVDEDQARVHEVECRIGQGVAHDVVPAHLDGGICQRFEKSRIEVGGEHPAAGAHLPGEPLSDAAASCRDLEALPSRRDTDGLQAADRLVVVQIGECGEALAGLPVRVVENVARVGHG